jgi:hypothetical protein
MNESAWRYVGKANPERLTALAQPLPNVKLPAALQCGLTLKCFHRESRSDEASYKRAVFCGTVDAQLFDWFFNAGTGYRGAFFESPDLGTRANRSLVDQLAPFLTDWALSQQLDRDRQWILASLSKTSAKAWLAEYPGLCNLCAGEWSTTYVSELHIENSRWETCAHLHSAWGRQAPRLSKVRIFGGFIDATQNEWLASHKAERAKHIWEHGWS